MKPRKNPQKLAKKLKTIRLALHLTQEELIKHLGAENELIQSHISAFEKSGSNRVPTYGVLLKYARAVNVSTDVLIDDELDLPEILSVSTEIENDFNTNNYK